MVIARGSGTVSGSYIRRISGNPGSSALLASTPGKPTHSRYTTPLERRTYQSVNQCDTLAGSRDRLQWLIPGSSVLKSGHPCRGASFSTIHNDLNETFAPLKCVTPVCIPIFQQKETVRDIKRLCETIALYEGCIFALLKCVSPVPGGRGRFVIWIKWLPLPPQGSRKGLAV